MCVRVCVLVGRSGYSFQGDDAHAFHANICGWGRGGGSLRAAIGGVWSRRRSRTEGAVCVMFGSFVLENFLENNKKIGRVACFFAAPGDDGRRGGGFSMA